jgi:cystathionine gamma-synthase
VASLESARHGLAFASGMAAEDTVLRAVLRPGDRVVVPEDAYGGTVRLVTQVLADDGIGCTATDLGAPEALDAGWPDGTKVLWIETPTNPRLTCLDIAALAAVAHAHGALVVVDNTFATPYLQQPLALDADVVVHSMTKYLGGHSDVLGGVVALDDDDLAERLAFRQKAVGAVASPFDCYLVLRGVKTLAVRMERHCTSARAVAALLEQHPAVSEVLYPGLPEHPGHAIACKQMRDFGGMVSFAAAGGEAAALRIVAGARVFTLAESLGAVESLIEHPARMTHASVADSTHAVDPALVRLSVGLETLDDLLDDLSQALEQA